MNVDKGESRELNKIWRTLRQFRIIPILIKISHTRDIGCNKDMFLQTEYTIFHIRVRDKE